MTPIYNIIHLSRIRVYGVGLGNSIVRPDQRVFVEPKRCIFLNNEKQNYGMKIDYLFLGNSANIYMVIS